MLRPLSPEGLKQIPVARADIPRVPEPTTGGAERARLRQACQDFEAIFLTYLLKGMRATVPEGGFLSDSREQRLFRDLLDEGLATRLAASGSTGLAEAMYRQVASRVKPPAEDPSATAESVVTPDTGSLKPLAGPAEDLE
jgi:flagellar protein FlgJ